MGGDHAYPVLLQQELNRHRPRVAVVNEGVPGSNSNTLLAHLEQSLQVCHPTLVVAMMGINDSGDRIPFTDAATQDRRPTLRLLRVVRYLQAQGRTQRVPAASPPESGRLESHVQALDRARSQNTPEAVLQAYQQALASSPVSLDLRYEMVRELVFQFRPPEALILPELQSLLREQPQDARSWLVWFGYQHIYRHDLVVAREALLRAYAASWEQVRLEHDQEIGLLLAMDKDPSFHELVAHLEAVCARRSSNDVLCRHLARFYRSKGDPAQARKYDGLAVQRSLGFVCDNTVRNYRRLRLRLQAAGIRLLCLQYAGRPLAPLKAMVGEHDGVWFADTEQEFARARLTHPYDELFTDTCYGDFGHGTALGNGIIAAKVAEVIMRERLYEPWARPAGLDQASEQEPGL